ncbi:MAG: FAD-dependent oxidoreductase, partial [Pseudomonadota bacterium]
ARRGARAALLDAARAQLGRVFGPEAAAPRDLLLMDWADEPLTTAAGDAAAPVTAHPAYGPPPKLGAPWDGRLHLAGAEHAAQFGGLLEGALEAADAALAALDHAARSWA